MHGCMHTVFSALTQCTANERERKAGLAALPAVAFSRLLLQFIVKIRAMLTAILCLEHNFTHISLRRGPKE